MANMKTSTDTTPIAPPAPPTSADQPWPAELAATEQDRADEAAAYAAFAAGLPVDPEIAERIHVRAMKIRKEIFRRNGLVDIGVPVLRELRGELLDS